MKDYMKYIRTKDGIYKIDSPIQPEKELQIKWIDDHCFETSWKTKPCEWRVADTIEELVDCYSYDIETTRDSAVARSWKKHHPERDIYACIKTSKGIIYVARAIISESSSYDEVDWELI